MLVFLPFCGFLIFFFKFFKNFLSQCDQIYHDGNKLNLGKPKPSNFLVGRQKRCVLIFYHCKTTFSLNKSIAECYRSALPGLKYVEKKLDTTISGQDLMVEVDVFRSTPRSLFVKSCYSNLTSSDWRYSYHRRLQSRVHKRAFEGCLRKKC